MTTTPIAKATASGKVILFGEHAVVYGRPAIAVPVAQVRAVATVHPGTDGLIVHAPDLNRTFPVTPETEGQPLVSAVLHTLRHMDAGLDHNLVVRIKSTVPVGRGLGSSAAVADAIIHAVGRHFGVELPADVRSRLVYETEVVQHATPSGIDNTVIAFNQPVYFMRDQPIQRFDVGRELHLVIADTGRATPTRETVGAVRAGWQLDPDRYEALFDAIAAIVDAARDALAAGDSVAVGRLMDENHARLRELDVSSRELDDLVYAARGAGALGAKLSGGGRGGNIVAVAMPWVVDEVEVAVREAGAVGVIRTVVQ
jgi:mevalonate kinase